MQFPERWTLLLAVLCGPLACAGETRDAPSARDKLRSYMAALEELHGLWNRAAKLVLEGRYDEARASLRQRPPEVLPEAYHRRHVGLPRAVNHIERLRTLHPHSQYAAELLFRLEPSAALAAQRYQHLDREGHLTSGRDRCCYAEALITLGRLEEADEQLQKVAATRRLKALRSLKPYADATVADLIEKYYPAKYCHALKNPGRACDGMGVVLRLWRSRLEEPRKLFLLARAFEVFRDPTGQRHAAMALGELPEAMDDPKMAGLLLERGNRLHQQKRLEEALEAWAPVVAHCTAPRVWGKATFNSGCTLRQLGRSREAIAVFERVLRSNVNDREPTPHIMETYRNYRHRACLAISASFEQFKDYDKALAYARMARDEHKFQTWCGTCAMSSRDALGARIERLARLADPSGGRLLGTVVAAALLAVVLLAVALLVRRRSRRARRPADGG